MGLAKAFFIDHLERLKESYLAQPVKDPLNMKETLWLWIPISPQSVWLAILLSTCFHVYYPISSVTDDTEEPYIWLWRQPKSYLPSSNVKDRNDEGVEGKGVGNETESQRWTGQGSRDGGRGKTATGPRKPAHTVQCSESFRTQ